MKIGRDWTVWSFGDNEFQRDRMMIFKKMDRNVEKKNLKKRLC